MEAVGINIGYLLSLLVVLGAVTAVIRLIIKRLRKK